MKKKHFKNEIKKGEKKTLVREDKHHFSQSWEKEKKRKEKFERHKQESHEEANTSRSSRCES